MPTKQNRLAIINFEKCKPKKCNQECKKTCPVEKQGKQCIDVTPSSKHAKISEELCIGCNLCVKACPFNAIQIVNLPTELEKNLIYTYGENSFRLYKLPIPKNGNILGFIGQNGIGKSTLMKILSDSLRPNFGDFESENIDEKTILKSTRGTELQKYLNFLYNGKLKIKTKIQNIDKLLKSIRKSKKKTLVSDLITKHYQDTEWHKKIIKKLELQILYENEVSKLSGGELQRLICAIVMLQDADVYIFDEPTNYLDIRQRLNVADLIRELKGNDKYIFIVEHDLSILDYTSDFVCIMYGHPGAYGIISSPLKTSSAINSFFNGYISSDNVRFRSEAYKFKNQIELEIEDDDEEYVFKQYDYESGIIEYDRFKLIINGGQFKDSCMILLLGQNGTGKTTFLKYLKKKLGLAISYKPQYLSSNKYSNKLISVMQLLSTKIGKQFSDPLFQTDVVNPLGIKRLFDKSVNKLSGGELQRVMITLCLGTDANVYLIDEPSASLDIEQRVIVTKVIKRFLLHNRKTGFIVEHDMMMAMSMSMEQNSKIIIFDQKTDEITGNRVSTSSKPMPFSEGINSFLAQLNITFRTDQSTKRPRINKQHSTKDSEQKRKNIYYD
jgi:ATP-binding cassette subfamily E protein 1